MLSVYQNSLKCPSLGPGINRVSAAPIKNTSWNIQVNSSLHLFAFSILMNAFKILDTYKFKIEYYGLPLKNLLYYLLIQ